MPEVNSEPSKTKDQTAAKLEQATAVQHQHEQPFKKYLLSSLIQSVVSTLLFHWFDRAFYLATIHKRPMWNSANFVSPFQGCLQAISFKFCFGSIYYIAQQEARNHIYPVVAIQFNGGAILANIAVGGFAGTVNALFTNPTSAIKSQMWGNDYAQFTPTAKKMWAAGKAEPFIRGVRPTIYRDMIFGSSYEVIRSVLHKMFLPERQGKKTQGGVLTTDFACNTTSGIIATLLSSPHNYAKNMQYKALPHQPMPSVTEIFRSLYQESRQQSGSLLRQLTFFGLRFNPHWGMLRTGAGMGAGQAIFDTVHAWDTARSPR